MYGTVMIGTLAEGISVDDYDLVAKEWLTREVEGFVDERVLLSDDGSTVVVAVRFTDRDAYQALADAPEQDEFYSARIQPLLAGEPQWIDGDWVRSYTG
ncbi:MAG: hypothetical protein WCD35_11890 [Mycobacteriales bacterium]